MALPLLAAAGIYLAGETRKDETRSQDRATAPPRVPPQGNASFASAQKFYSPFEQPNQFNLSTGGNWGNYFGGPRRTPHGLPHDIRAGAFGEGGQWNLNKVWNGDCVRHVVVCMDQPSCSVRHITTI